MRVYLNKKLIKMVLVVILVMMGVFLFLKLVSLWDSTQGAVDMETIQTTAPSVNAQNQLPTISVREPTDEERQGLPDGTLTKTELIQNLVNDAVVYPPNDPEDSGTASSLPENAPPEHTVPNTRPVQTEYERRIAEIIAEVYVLRDEYIGRLERMYTEAEAALNELADKKTSKEEIAFLVSSYLSKATELELQCDEQIDVISAEMDVLIRENHGDTNLVDTLIETYATEKATKKAWYIARLEEKGLIS